MHWISPCAHDFFGPPLQINAKLKFLGFLKDDTDQINELCPDGVCLGEACRQSTAQCFVSCEPRYEFTPASEADCLSGGTGCQVSGIPGGGCDGEYCVYCPGGDTQECQYVALNQGDCESTVACELDDGSVLFGLTEEECNDQSGYCTVDCPGESCRSLEGIFGVCLASVGSETACNNLNSIGGVEAVWYDGSICVISTDTEDSCAQVFL